MVPVQRKDWEHAAGRQSGTSPAASCFHVDSIKLWKCSLESVFKRHLYADESESHWNWQQSQVRHGAGLGYLHPLTVAITKSRYFYVVFKTKILCSFVAQPTAMLLRCHHCQVASQPLPKGWLWCAMSQFPGEYLNHGAAGCYGTAMPSMPW